MKKLLAAVFVACILACGCWAPPLQLKYYSKNVIVAADGTLSYEGKKLSLKNLKQNLVANMIMQNSPITIHFHKKVSREEFDMIVGKFKQEGFANLDTAVYGD